MTYKDYEDLFWHILCLSGAAHRYKPQLLLSDLHIDPLRHAAISSKASAYYSASEPASLRTPFLALFIPSRSSRSFLMRDKARLAASWSLSFLL